MTIGVVVFPGSNCEHDVVFAIESAGGSAELVWHRETDLSGLSGLVLPGGFAHGDYLRTGAIARFSPVMREVERMASQGAPVLGICNGFQILTEAGLLPGALIANRDMRFICRWIEIEVVDTGTILTSRLEEGSVHRIPLNSYEGSFVDPSGTARTVMRYLDDPNGSEGRTAATANAAGNVVGVMPHPERGVEQILGSSDGLAMFESLVAAAEGVHV